MEQIPSFTAESGGVLVPLSTKVRGNIQLIVHHIRAIPIARKANIVSVVCSCQCIFVMIADNHIVCVCVCVCGGGGGGGG